MAQVDYFLKLDGIKGESADAKHKDEIDVESFSWGISQTGAVHTGGGASAGKASFSDFSFMMRFNAASPSLMRSCATGQHIKSGTLSCRKAGKDQQEFLTIKMTDVIVSSYQTSASSEEPFDSVSLNFAKLEVDYKQQGKDGKLAPGGTFGFDLKSNKSV